VRRLYTNHQNKRLKKKGASTARKNSKEASTARLPSQNALQVPSSRLPSPRDCLPPPTVNNLEYVYTIDVGEWSLRGYNIGVNSCGFVGFHKITAVSGGSNVARERISIQGRPGTRACVIDRYAVDLVFRGKGHGQRLFECLANMFRAAGSYEFVVTNPTAPGKKFYKRVGFVQDHAGDYRFILNAVITTT
jgi:GNAT superfamily N-acetyltransferase